MDINGGNLSNIVIFSAILHQWNWYYFSTLAFIKATRIFYIFDYKLHFCLDFWFIYSKGILPNLPKTSTVRTPLRGDPQRELLCPLSGGGVSASLRGRLLSCVCRSVGVKRRHTAWLWTHISSRLHQTDATKSLARIQNYVWVYDMPTL